MTQHAVYTGIVEGDGLGDKAKAAFDKVNLDIAELFGMVVRLSGVAGVDTTGIVDSLAAVRSILATIAGTAIRLLVDCPVFLDIGFDHLKPLIIENRTNVEFTTNGKFITNANLIPTVVFEHCSDCTWTDPLFEFIGTNDNDYHTHSAAANFNDITMKAWLIANRGNTFTSQNPYWNGPTQGASLIRIGGRSQRLRFYNLRVQALSGALAVNFCPTVVSCTAQWLPSIPVVAVMGTDTTSTVDIPRDILFDTPEFDGFYMGFVGTAYNLRLLNPNFKRYSDLQDAAGANVGGPSTWFAPPHAFYMGSYGPTFTGLTARYQLINAEDLGSYVGVATRRSTGSGSMCSLKVALENDTIVLGYNTLRPDGGADITSYGNGKGSMKDFSCTFDSSTAISGGPTPIWGVRFPSSINYVKMRIDGLEVIDTAAAPADTPIRGNNNALNADCSITGVKCFVEDWPAGATYYPGFAWIGTRCRIDAEYHFAACNATQTFRGCIANQGNIDGIIDCYWTMVVFGWRDISSSPAALEQRVLLSNDVNRNNRAKITDITNGWEAEVCDGTKEVSWSQSQTFVPAAGAFVDTTIVVPANSYIDRYGSHIKTTLGNGSGLTGIDLGWSGTSSALYANKGITIGTNPISRLGVDAGTAAKTIRLTSVGGNFDGVGEIRVNVRSTIFCADSP